MHRRKHMAKHECEQNTLTAKAQSSMFHPRACSDDLPRQPKCATVGCPRRIKAPQSIAKDCQSAVLQVSPYQGAQVCHCGMSPAHQSTAKHRQLGLPKCSPSSVTPSGRPSVPLWDVPGAGHKAPPEAYGGA